MTSVRRIERRPRRRTVPGRATARLAAALVGVLLGVGGCTVLPEVGKPLDLYTLTPKTTFEGPLPKVDWQLVVEMPLAAAGLDTSRIAIARTPFRLDYYAGAVWTENAPAMVQTLMIESFESTHRIVAVGREAIGLRPDYILKTDLREFQAVYYDSDGPGPTVLVRMNAKLVQMPERRIIAARTVEREVEAESSRLADIITAFDTALGRVLKEIVVFTLTAPPPTGPAPLSAKPGATDPS
ncbi:MAG TPA: ABC-type transport auxiliary lipoprotein family protein [Dongiaceae bacterium]|nr:ABC-type transport auxiliary lipoprotein family protein [Dongiaceae bacterium]